MQCKIVWLLLDVVVSSCLHKEEVNNILFHLISQQHFFLSEEGLVVFFTQQHKQKSKQEADASQFTVSRSISKKARLVPGTEH